MTAHGPKRRWTILMVLPGILFPGLRLCAESPSVTTSTPIKTVDVRLDPSGNFHGVVVNGQGARLHNEPITIRRVGRDQGEATVRTDRRGDFRFAELQAGTYQVVTTEGVCLCRLWTHAAAPPAAAEKLLVVSDAQLERGQRPIREILYRDPLLMATVIAAAIAIPIAVNKSRDKDAEGS